MRKSEDSSTQKMKGTRDLRTRVNKHSMELESVTSLLCPLCNEREYLIGRRVEQKYKIKLTVEMGNTRRLEATDVCSRCVQRSLDVLQPGMSAEDR